MEVKSLVRNKKGMGLGDLYPVILTIALVAILLAVVLFVLSEFGEAMPLRTVNVANESITAWVEGVNQTVTGAATCGFGTVTTASVVVYNTTGAYLIGAGNYTAYSDGNIINASDTDSMYAWQVSYPYTWRGEACDATENVTEDFTDFIPWIGVILLIVAAAIVLGIVIRSFAGGRRV